MNREYRLIGIATGRLNPEDIEFELTKEDEKSIQEYKDIIKKAKENGEKIILYAPDSDE